jgi:hypothetical protein
MWPRRHDTVSRPGRKPTALCPVDGLCFAWVPSDRAGRHSREEESFLPVRPWSAVDPYFQSTPMQVKQHEQIEARLALSCGRRSWTPRSSSPRTWAQGRHPWCSRRWSAKPKGAQPADTRRCGAVRQPTCRRWSLCFIPIHSVTSTDSPRSCSVHRPDPPESH